MANAFKSFGEQKRLSDLALTFAGSIGAIMNGVSRIFWPIYQDTTSFKHVYSRILLLQITVSSTLYFAASSEHLYIVWIALSFFCLGGHFSVFPTACVTYFGLDKGPQVYAVLFTAIGSTSMIGFLIGKYLLDMIGYAFFFSLATAMSIISLLILFCLFEEQRPQGTHEL